MLHGSTLFKRHKTVTQRDKLNTFNAGIRYGLMKTVRRTAPRRFQKSDIYDGFQPMTAAL